MSPFDLHPRNRLLCLPDASRHVAEHARSCTCPCPWCVQLHEAHLRQAGLLDTAQPENFGFVYALGHLQVEKLTKSRPLFALYVDICQKHGVREREPIATFGWMFQVGETLEVVRAASDPWKLNATDALSAWGQEQGVKVVPRGQGISDDEELGDAHWETV